MMFISKFSEGGGQNFTHLLIKILDQTVYSDFTVMILGGFFAQISTYFIF